MFLNTLLFVCIPILINLLYFCAVSFNMVAIYNVGLIYQFQLPIDCSISFKIPLPLPGMRHPTTSCATFLVLLLSKCSNSLESNFSMTSFFLFTISGYCSWKTFSRPSFLKSIFRSLLLRSNISLSRFSSLVFKLPYWVLGTPFFSMAALSPLS